LSSIERPSEDAVLAVLHHATEPLSAREIAAIIDGVTVKEAIASGRSASTSKTCLSLVSKGTLTKDYPYGKTYVTYAPAGARMVAAA
jgi:hypothetical protein